MKKYIEPKIDVMTIQTTHLVMESVTGTNLEGVTKGGKFAGGSVDSRGGSSWDDDEE